MPKEHFQSAGESVEHGDASALFPVEEPGGTILQGRDVELALADADGQDVIVVGPTSLASSYFITQHTPTAIPIEGLSPEFRSKLANKLETPIQAFDLIQIGKWTTDRPDHSLAGYTVL